MATATTIGQQSILSNTTTPAHWNAAATGKTFPYDTKNVVHAAVEKVDNGFILRMGPEGHIVKVKICRDMDELKDMFVATLVDFQLEK